MNRIPSDAINEVKCSLCHNYLSYFPTLSTEEGDVCGRCSILEGKVAFHNRAYEKIAQHIKFPCRFKEQGCFKELLPKDVPSHEEKCHFKIVQCPGKEFTDCSWQGACNSMLSHCRNIHKDLFLENKSFELNLEDSSGNFYLQKFLEYNGSLFIVAIMHDLLFMHPKTVSFMIHHVEDEIIDLENYSYQVVLSRDETDVMVKSSTTTFSERIWRKIGLDCLMMSNEASPIIGNIVFKNSFFDVTRNGFNEKMLTILTCTKCKNYILPPIQCLCDKIKCSFCLPVGEAECHCSSLNEITKMLYYPCRYKQNGCDVVLKSEKVEKHLSICQFKTVECWFCCVSDKKIKEYLKKVIRNHIFQTHCDLFIMNGEKICVENIKTHRTNVIHWDNKLFLLEFTIGKNNVYEWVVYILDKVDEKFQCEIELMNPKLNNMRVLVQLACLPIPFFDIGEEYILENLSELLCLEEFFIGKECRLENLSELLRLEESITFRVNIFKN